MGMAKAPPPVKLIVGMISREVKLFEEAESRMQSEFGPIDFVGPILPFDYTDYYREEMGEGLNRKFVSFERLIRSDEIAAIKMATNRWEEELADSGEGKRRINLDPGYIALAKFVLATTKDYSHRIHLGGGIYAEVALHFHKGTYQPYDWTYPDYRSRAYIDIFNGIRQIYKSQIPS